jgi:hypothetical protein
MTSRARRDDAALEQEVEEVLVPLQPERLAIRLEQRRGRVRQAEPGLHALEQPVDVRGQVHATLRRLGLQERNELPRHPEGLHQPLRRRERICRIGLGCHR